MSKDLGKSTSYAYYVAEGGTKTPQEYGEMLVNIDTVATRAEDAADSAAESATGALNSKNAAQTAATTATNKATEATTAATTATTKAGEASTSASTATSAKDTAVSASQTATAKATEATTAAATAVSAKDDAVSANTSAQSAKTAAQTAQTGAETAAASVQSSAAQIATNAEDISQLKSDFADMKSDGAVPSAEQILTDKGVTDSVPYHYRKTGGDGADRLYDQIVGGTVCWNQLVQNGNFADGSGWTANKGNVSVASNKLTFTLTEKNNYAYVGRADLENSIVGHKYFVGAYITVSEASSYLAISRGGVYSDRFFALAVNARTYCAKVLDATASNGNFYIYPRREGTGFEVGSTMIVEDAICHDLTAMFGSTIADYIYNLEQTTAGAGVAFFKSLFPNDYYPYNAGELVSVSGLSEHKMVGFNQWDEEWETGNISYDDGSNQNSSTNVRSKNYIHVVSGATYYAYIGSGTGLRVIAYDANKAFLSAISGTTSIANAVFTIPSGAFYIRIATAGYSSATYKNDICINLSDPAKNGTYEPYKDHRYPLDGTLVLRGLFKLDADNNLYADGDTYDADGTVTRKYGIVDLGTLNWADAGTYYASTTALPNVKAPGSGGTKANAMAGKYIVVTSNGVSGGSESGIGIRPNGIVYVTNTGSTPSGHLVYELATPTTETADPYQHLQQCDPNGTEEYASTGIVPIGHNSFYPENLKAKIDGLPWNFANLIAPTESTFTATRNYTTGALFIVDNVLYKATSNIANGGTITPNTNCTATTLAEIISALA